MTAMVSGIAVPNNILEDIKADGKAAATKNEEAIGFLFCRYKESEDLLVAEERHSLPTKIGDNEFISKLIDFVKSLFYLGHYMDMVSKFDDYERRLEANRQIAVRVNYHSHPDPSLFSYGDLKALASASKYSIHSALLLYITSSEYGGEGDFVAVNHGEEYIHVYREIDGKLIKI